MSALKVMAVFGTRPEGVKMAPLINELRACPNQIDLRVVVTGQHRQMLDQILSAFSITPDDDLNIMQPGQSLAQIACRSLEGLDRLIEEHQPKLIIAQGDTSTTFAASLAAFYRKVDFGHVEAGLRSDNRWEPFPEEMNRRMTSLCATMHFAPTELAMGRLKSEGIPRSDIWLTGNTVIDALKHIAAIDEPLEDQALDNFIRGGEAILVTAHRRENWGEPMRDICRAIAQISDGLPESRIVFAMHKNPIVRETVVGMLGGKGRIMLIEPPDYMEFVKLMKRVKLILTDSGGVQEEAPSLGIPVLVLRNTTERPEGVDAGNAMLVGSDTETIVSRTLLLMRDWQAYRKMAQARNPYGDGNASVRIRKAIFERYGLY